MAQGALNLHVQTMNSPRMYTSVFMGQLVEEECDGTCVRECAAGCPGRRPAAGDSGWPASASSVSAAGTQSSNEAQL